MLGSIPMFMYTESNGRAIYVIRQLYVTIKNPK